jgi:hypothetical protein
MSAELIGVLIEWRRTPPGQELTDKEFIVLHAIADRVLDHEGTRMMRKFHGDDCELRERICQVARLDNRGLKEVLGRLTARGLDVKVVLRKDQNGNPIYATRAEPMQFRFPELPTVVWIPRVVEACG